ncbi:hypothetical protein HPB47_008911 [Ixodes persulcatus]|uniref:Uncharacterized protein n=1 Tax=Ixodes persulcatus TaxID=34615 RepID=A0AC60P3E4_IXOPE|nr:hypothetical protein HPB47_008911 [Ixodes persulcatus]
MVAGGRRRGYITGKRKTLGENSNNGRFNLRRFGRSPAFDGFVQNAAEVFRAEKGSGDYHLKMNVKRFEAWFTYKLLSNMKDPNVVVRHNAPYHSVKVHATPTGSSLNKTMQDWLTMYGDSRDPTILKAELLSLMNTEQVAQPDLEKLSVDAKAEQHDHQVTARNWWDHVHAISMEKRMWRNDKVMEIVIDCTILTTVGNSTEV